jgi:hypothetical protein
MKAYMIRLQGASTLSLFVVALLAGCAGDDAGRDDAADGASGKADELDDDMPSGPSGLAHRDWILTCDELSGRIVDRTNEARIDEIVAAERNRLNCLELANDSVVEVIDNALTNAESAEAGRTDSRFATYRDATQDLCNVFVEASAGALDKTGALLSQRCSSDGERAFGDIIDAYVALTIEPITIPESRALYSGCYGAFDDAGAVGHAAEVEALEDLATCIQMDNDAMRAAVMEGIVTNFPGRSSSDLEEETYRYLRGAQDAIDNLCSTVSEAGEATDAAFVESQYATCIVAANAQIGELAASVDTALFGAGGASDGGTSDTGGGTDSGSDSGTAG